MKKLEIALFALVIFLAAFVRFLKLDKVPAALYYDEIDLSYQMKSFLSTGKDYRDNLSPFFFRSFSDDKTPLPIYFSIIPSLFFKSPEYQTRAGAAFTGVLVVILAMVLTYQFTIRKSTTLIVGVVFAFSPWLIQFSRLGFEAIFSVFLLLAALVVFLCWESGKKFWAFSLSAILIGLNVYTYRPMSLFIPLLILILLVIYHKDFLKIGLKKTLIWLSLMAVIILPFLYATTLASADKPRISLISIFSDPKNAVEIQRAREIDSSDFANPEIGKKAAFSSKVLHNKVFSLFQAFIKSFYRTFSMDFLFLTGDPNIRHNPKNAGELLFLDIIGLIVGLVFVFKNLKQKKHQLLLALLFLTPIPSDLTVDGANHASRLIIFTVPLLLIIGLGYSETARLLSFGKKKFLFFLLPVLWLSMLIFHLHNYFVHYPIDSAKEFGYGYKQAIQKIRSLQEQYQAVRLTIRNDNPTLYYLYYAGVSPRELQEYGTEFSEDTERGLPLDRIKPIGFPDPLSRPEQIVKLRPDTLYLVSFTDLPVDLRSRKKEIIPRGIKLLDVFKYPNNEVAYYLITRDTQNGKPVMPDSTKQSSLTTLFGIE